MPKAVKVNDMEHDWSKAAAYADGDIIRCGVVNGWVPEIAGIM